MVSRSAWMPRTSWRTPETIPALHCACMSWILQIPHDIKAYPQCLFNLYNLLKDLSDPIKDPLRRTPPIISTHPCNALSLFKNSLNPSWNLYNLSKLSHLAEDHPDRWIRDHCETHGLQGPKGGVHLPLCDPVLEGSWKRQRSTRSINLKDCQM